MSSRDAPVFWFTGLSGSGKTTLSQAAAARLRQLGRPCLVLDGDLMRQGLCADLSFRPQDRLENIRRAGEIALLISRQGIVSLCAFITPYARMREALRLRLGPRYHEIHVACPLSTCMRRDPKQNYARASAGLIAGYTGLADAYEPPQAPNFRIDTDASSEADCVERVLDYIRATLSASGG